MYSLIVTQQEARRQAKEWLGLHARVIGEDDVISTTEVVTRRIGVQWPDPTVRSLKTFLEYGSGRTWEEAFAAVQAYLQNRD